MGALSPHGLLLFYPLCKLILRLSQQPLPYPLFAASPPFFASCKPCNAHSASLVMRFFLAESKICRYFALEKRSLTENNIELIHQLPSNGSMRQQTTTSFQNTRGKHKNVSKRKQLESKATSRFFVTTSLKAAQNKGRGLHSQT